MPIFLIQQIDMLMIVLVTSPLIQQVVVFRGLGHLFLAMVLGFSFLAFLSLMLNEDLTIRDTIRGQHFAINED